MKPAAFGFRAPSTLREALDILVEGGDDAKIIAGGQSLVPMMNFRLVRPSLLVDINQIHELSSIRRRDGALRIGAMTRQSKLAESTMAQTRWPLFGKVLKHVAHAQIRNRGTVGGSIAHADPASELCCAALAYNAEIIVASRRGQRTVHAAEFFVGQLVTSLEPDEIVVEVVVPPVPGGTGTGFAEYARRHGDFAFAGVAALLTRDGSGNCIGASVTALGVAPTAYRSTEAEAALQGTTVEDDAVTAAVNALVDESSPSGDMHGTAEYRKLVLAEVARRAINQAWSDGAEIAV